MSNSTNAVWVFGYGSLIWRPDFEFEDSQLAVLSGYQRNFCQASHDHRGTPERPGRVVTLTASANQKCTGVAYRLGQSADEVLAALDIREQDGYDRIDVQLLLNSGARIQAITWVANPGNPSWRGDEPISELAQLIATRAGPSGSNRQYLIELALALTRLGIEDDYVIELNRRVHVITG